MRAPSAILIAGPTASGKSALAVDVARELGGVVINADSMQVYRDLRVLTARPDAQEEVSAPHALYGHVDGAENYSVGHYLKDARQTLERIREDRRLPIVVGGTGLYFKALLEGLSEIPPVPESVREDVRARSEERDTPSLYADLAVLDAEAARGLRPTDRLRILRALEVLAATGRSITAFRTARTPGPLSGASCLKLFLDPGREALKQRIDERFEIMMGQGALGEVERLLSRRLDPALPVMRAHGVPWLARHLCGEISLNEAVRASQSDTRRYAKRQYTWFRHQMPGWTWVSPDKARSHVLNALPERTAPSV